MRLSGDYFELTDRLPTAARPRATTESVLVISVAKRIVKSAVRRNTVRRVVRESWRATLAVAAGTGTEASLSAEDPRTEAPRHWLIRLRAHPVPKPVASTSKGSKPKSPASKPGASAAAAAKASGPVPPAPGFAAVKRLLRSDADRLFRQALRSGQRRPRTVHFSPVDREVQGSRRNEV